MTTYGEILHSISEDEFNNLSAADREPLEIEAKIQTSCLKWAAKLGDTEMFLKSSQCLPPWLLEHDLQCLKDAGIITPASF